MGQAIIFLSCGFYLLSSSFFLSSFFPSLISAVGDWMSTILPYMVWPVEPAALHAAAKNIIYFTALAVLRRRPHSA